ncbi:MAG: DUF3793 family protein [Eubacterium sp.]|nr:DUF3793 family protein [Eubacterium sp.]
MPISEMKKVIEGKNREQQVALVLAMHGAAILRGSKIANLFTVSQKDALLLKKLLQGTKINYRIIVLKNQRVMVYLYRREYLKSYLFNEQVLSFIAGYGYCQMTLEEMLDLLMTRITKYRQGKAEFPHEIGIFLGYPLEDVLGFLENRGENFSYVGYWKVYCNVQEKIKIFDHFDRERDWVIREVLSGKKIREIAV